MKWVDKISSEGQDERPYVDRLKWKIDESGILTGQVDNSYHYAEYASKYLSGYYDEIRTPEGIISGQLSTYNYLSGPDEAHQPHIPIISSLN